MTSPWAELDRPPLRAEPLRRALVRDGEMWTDIQVVGSTGSTNTDLAELARSGAAEGSVLVAEEQTRGRGRLDRGWVAPPRAALMLSVLVRPAAVPPERRGWLPLLAGVAMVRALRRVAEVRAVLKWPNDIMLNGRKLAGILAEQSAGAVVIGLGLNVHTRAEELPAPTATSLAAESAPVTDRDPLLRAYLRAFAELYLPLRAVDGDAELSGLLAEYRELCDTIGREVRVMLPGGGELTGTAAEVDTTGRLVVRGPSGERALSAGDVVHVRGSRDDSPRRADT
ncbi:biotin--[acetyl-CoA-carboxylase] ligase [Allonocardiopsis opalescens]|uniref:biotin--[biotin carboxyl-carrier protein] ligase n=1 Tax=Allonocardiopsis opalescens TaxID=1144618 RepID=A0A2T0QBV2_9ACTN|nr:biotin--[acetyl-CoA-carboxylase] ligase [Allonocardiopsis opalescens]PRY01434.1 BirA family biotin operon repressor/biotin-[acetyl-CoA-carboxylase] ligase [Allonocardiopsis opalescens]